MRIIGGAARGIQLRTPGDRAIRPTLDRVREAVFNILAPRIEGGRFLDLFAGTGAIGLEALSRGAAHVDWVEADPGARALIEENLRRIKLENPGAVLTRPFRADRALEVRGQYDLVYADPPHSFAEFEALLDCVSPVLDSAGVFVLEHASDVPVPSTGAGLRRVRDAAYGRTTLSFYEHDRVGKAGDE